MVRLRCFPAALLAIVVTACASPVDHDDVDTAAIKESLPATFCTAPRSVASTAAARLSYWNSEDVQSGIRATLKSPEFGCTPHSGYLAAYAAMTKARDAARCTDGSPMKPPTPLDTRINDALADLMTRNYVQVVTACLTGKLLTSGADIGGSFCAMHALAENDDWSALRVALGGTAYYLSTHIAAALSAIPHIDEIWDGTEFDTLAKRVNRLKDFKSSYDSFNAFLGNNLSTVATSLRSAGLTPPSCGAATFDLACSLAGRAGVPTIVFENRRNFAFEQALVLAQNIPPGKHPWTVGGADGRIHGRATISTAPAYPKNDAVDGALKALTTEGKRLEAALANPLMQNFGSLSFSALKDAKKKAACEKTLKDY